MFRLFLCSPALKLITYAHLSAFCVGFSVASPASWFASRQAFVLRFEVSVAQGHSSLLRCYRLCPCYLYLPLLADPSSSFRLCSLDTADSSRANMTSRFCFLFLTSLFFCSCLRLIQDRYRLQTSWTRHKWSNLIPSIKVQAANDRKGRFIDHAHLGNQLAAQDIHQ